jgi:ribosomal protein L3 glutamine methyltransferase
LDPQSQSIESTWLELTKILEAANLHFGHGAVSASSEAFWTLSHCLQIDPAEVLGSLENPCPEQIKIQALKFIQERISSRKPLAYILGEVWLMGAPFYCDDRSIVPRSFIAELISDGTLEPWLPAGGRALDLCTGNGSLAILLALNCPDIDVSACDLSPQALALAARNLDRHHLTDQINLYQGDLWDPLPEPNEDNLFDLIICNPPYVNSHSMAQLPKEYLAEPKMALAGGEDGMEIIRRILEGAKPFLAERGALLLEIGNEFEHFSKAFPDIPVTWIEVSAGEEQVLLIEAENLP